MGDRVGDRAPAGIIGPESVSASDIGPLVERHPDNPVHQRLKVFVAGDKISLGVHFDDDADIAPDRRADQPVGGDPAAFLGGLGEPLLAQPVDRGT